MTMTERCFDLFVAVWRGAHLRMTVPTCGWQCPTCGWQCPPVDDSAPRMDDNAHLVNDSAQRMDDSAHLLMTVPTCGWQCPPADDSAHLWMTVPTCEWQSPSVVGSVHLWMCLAFGWRFFNWPCRLQRPRTTARNRQQEARDPGTQEVIREEDLGHDGNSRGIPGSTHPDHEERAWA